MGNQPDCSILGSLHGVASPAVLPVDAEPEEQVAKLLVTQVVFDQVKEAEVRPSGLFVVAWLALL